MYIRVCGYRSSLALLDFGGANCARTDDIHGSGGIAEGEKVVIAVCCSVLQCVAVCCRVLPCVAVCCRVLQCVAVCCSVLPCVAVCCSVLQCVTKEVCRGVRNS